MILGISQTTVDGVEAERYELRIQGHPVECIVVDPRLPGLPAEEAERRIEQFKNVCRPILRRAAIKDGRLATVRNPPFRGSWEA